MKIGSSVSTQSWKAPELAIIVPSYNERDNIVPLYEKVSAALEGINFEFIVVDDNSPDGTANVVRQLALTYPNVRCVQRVGRRGLSSACIEGFLSSAAPFLAVMDADHQHDESILPKMLDKAKAGADVVIGTRYAGDGTAGNGLASTREAGSRFATRLSNMLTGVKLSDPLTGFFLLRREIFEEALPTLSEEGFKILLDLIISATRFRGNTSHELHIGEVPYHFRPRLAGESKMILLIVIQFLGLLLSKLTGGVLPISFLLFSMVGATGVFVHLVSLFIMHDVAGFGFTIAQLAATLVAMTTNFVLNNELTYADRKLRGRRFIIGLLTFYAVCSFGTVANVSVGTWLYNWNHELYFAGLMGALMSTVFNFAVTRIFTWR